MKKKSAGSLKEIVRNNSFAVSLIWKHCPFMIVYSFLRSFADGILGTIELFFIGHAISLAASGSSYLDVCKYLMIYIAINISYNVITAVLTAKSEPVFNYQIGCGIKRMFLQKALDCDLRCYEDTQFYKDFTLAAAQCIPRAEASLSMISGLITSITALCSLGVLSYLIDPVVFLFFLAPVFSLFINGKKSKTEFRMYGKQTEYNRQKDYCVRTFFRPEYAKEMRVSNISAPILARFKDAVDNSITLYKSEGMKCAVLGFIQSVYSELFSNLFILLYVAYRMLISKSIQMGDCIIVVKAISDMNYAMQGLIGVLSAFRENALFVSNVKTFLNYKSSIESSSHGYTAENGDIVFKDVSFRYDGAADDTLKHLSFHLKKGEKVAVVGLNGAGKSTLVKLLLRLYDPTDGSIYLNGTKITELNLKSYRDMYATLLQDYHSFSMSVKENILLRNERDGDDIIVESALCKSGFKERVGKMEKGIDTTVGKEFDADGEVLSGGEYQKLALAHVFAKESPILILDEPSSALDPVSEAEMYKNITESCGDNTVIYISHRMSSAKAADHILFIENGCLAEEGSHTELIEKNGKYAELFRIQAQNYGVK